MNIKYSLPVGIVAAAALAYIGAANSTTVTAPPLNESVTKVERVLTHNPAWGTSQITCDTPTARVTYNSPTVKGFAVKARCVWVRDANSDGNPDSNKCGGCSSGSEYVTTVMANNGGYLFTNVMAYKSTGTFVCRITPNKMNCHKQ